MADSFGLKLGIEGEKEFKKSLAEINQSFKVLGSEMKLVSSQFDKNDNSVQALSARNTVLNKEIDAQKQKIETLRQALANASESFGKTDRRTQSWQIQLNNAEASLNGMERELNSNNSALEQAKTDIEGTEKSLEKVDGRLDDTAESADDMGDEIKDAGDKADKSKERFSKLGSVLKGVGVAMGAVVTAAAATAVKLGKEVVNAYADYEQLVGGVDTLFKGSSQKLQSYASNAYKTAGLSANDYMETVTGFSASLIQSLGGDTDKSVKYANMAITDMADNANKMVDSRSFRMHIKALQSRTTPCSITLNSATAVLKRKCKDFSLTQRKYRALSTIFRHMPMWSMQSTLCRRVWILPALLQKSPRVQFRVRLMR